MQVTAGYKTFTGYTLTQADADAYNRHDAAVQGAIAKAGAKPSPLAQKEIDFRIDQRHRLFVAIAYTGAN